MHANHCKKYPLARADVEPKPKSGWNGAYGWRIVGHCGPALRGASVRCAMVQGCHGARVHGCILAASVLD